MSSFELTGIAVFVAIAIAAWVTAVIRRTIKLLRIHNMLRELPHCSLKQVKKTCDEAGLKLGAWRSIFNQADPFLLGQTCASLLRFEETGGKESEDAEIIEMLEQIDRGEQSGPPPNLFKSTMEDWFKTVAIHICGKKQSWIDGFLDGVGKNNDGYKNSLVSALNKVRSKKANEKMLAERKKKLRQGVAAATGKKKPTNKPGPDFFGEETAGL